MPGFRIISPSLSGQLSKRIFYFNVLTEEFVEWQLEKRGSKNFTIGTI